MAMEFQFGKKKKVPEMDGGDGYTRMSVCLMPRKCTLKMVSFLLCIC